MYRNVFRASYLFVLGSVESSIIFNISVVYVRLPNLHITISLLVIWFKRMQYFYLSHYFAVTMKLLDLIFSMISLFLFSSFYRIC